MGQITVAQDAAWVRSSGGLPRKNCAVESADNEKDQIVKFAYNGLDAILFKF